MNWRERDMRRLNAPITTHDPADPPEDERVRCPHGVVLEDDFCPICEDPDNEETR